MTSLGRGRDAITRLCFAFGTRPEAIKLAPVIHLAKQQADCFETHVCVTGQHREMLDQMLSVFGIVPDTALNLRTPDQTLAADHPEVGWVYPVHLNPNVQEPVRRILGGRENVYLIEPQPYAAFVWLMERCECILLTDSGGVQEEAPSLGKPVLVMCETTERPEGVDAGVVRLVWTRSEAIVAGCEAVLANATLSRSKASPYGDGEAASMILARLGSSVAVRGETWRRAAQCR